MPDSTKAVLVVGALILLIFSAIGVDKLREADCESRLIGSGRIMFETTRPRCDLALPLWFAQWVSGQGG